MLKFATTRRYHNESNGGDKHIQNIEICLRLYHNHGSSTDDAILKFDLKPVNYWYISANPVNREEAYVI